MQKLSSLEIRKRLDGDGWEMMCWQSSAEQQAAGVNIRTSRMQVDLSSTQLKNILAIVNMSEEDLI